MRSINNMIVVAFFLRMIAVALFVLVVAEVDTNKNSMMNEDQWETSGDGGTPPPPSLFLSCDDTARSQR